MTRVDWIVASVAPLRPRRWLALRYRGPLADLDPALVAREIGAPRWLHRVDDASGLAPAGRCDCAVVLDQLEYMAGSERRHLLARLRDLHAPNVLVCVTPTVAREWPANDWRALHFEPGERIQDGGADYVTYRFNLATYNPQRSWNNPDQWAHPHNFDRFRW